MDKENLVKLEEEVQRMLKDFYDANPDCKDNSALDDLVRGLLYHGAVWAEKELVHEPDNPEGITANELKHQLYGAKFARQEVIDEACKWLQQLPFALLSGYEVHNYIVDFKKAMEEKSCFATKKTDTAVTSSTMDNA